MSSVRVPAVAGSFYPADPQRLRAMVMGFLAEARPSASDPRPCALIVPHAGYVYSGPVAASAYALLRGASIRRVVLLGPSHHVALAGLALPGAEGLLTPLGTVRVDGEACARAEELEGVQTLPAAHAHEHSLEVQLPFLQAVLDDFAVVPLVVGQAGPAVVARVIEALWGGGETLVVVSSDLSHYLPYEVAQKVDQGTADRIVSPSGELLEPDQACGAAPVNGLCVAARRRELVARRLDLRNSGDTAGDRARVVGYGAFSFHERARA